MPKLIPIKPRRLVKIINRLGFVERDAEGSHVFFRHADGRTTVVPMHNRELSKGLLRKILNDIHISLEEYDMLRQQ